jgi:hypothetical protein
VTIVLRLSNKQVVIGLGNKKRDDGGRGVKKCPKLRDVIYRRPYNLN